MDSITLKDMTFHVNIGLGDSERSKMQPVTVTVVMYLQLERAGSTNNISDTVNYAHVYESIKHAVEAGSFDLLEGLAEDISHIILQKFRVEQVRIIATKKPADLVAQHVGSVSVDILRTAK